MTPQAPVMKAIVQDRFGPPDVLRLAEVPIPTPEHDEVLIRIHATTVTSAESGMRQATTTSQIIHARVRTQATRIRIVCVSEKPSEPTTHPCTR